jgi:bifunctional DNA-binding transcriptional regulator/antitoxin component of YhaV-PrlF toxin-antitoxin module
LCDTAQDEEKNSVFEIKYNGTDLVIPKNTIEEQLGFRPGDTLHVLIRGKIKLAPLVRLPDEIENMRIGLEAMAGSWSAQDVEQFQQLRQELWSAWQIPKSV